MISQDYQMNYPVCSTYEAHVETKKSKALNFYKTKMCPFLLQGACAKGNQCTYAHSYCELKPSPDLRKIRLCKFFQNGYCPKGSDCFFAHSTQELRAPPDYYKISLCIPYITGKVCKSGDRCRFAHGEKELRPRNAPPQEAYNYTPPISGQLINSPNFFTSLKTKETPIVSNALIQPALDIGIMPGSIPSTEFQYQKPAVPGYFKFTDPQPESLMKSNYSIWK